MTIFANRSEHAKDAIKVGITYGPVSTSIEENVGHLRGFHTQLGQLLDQIEAEKAAATE